MISVLAAGALVQTVQGGLDYRSRVVDLAPQYVGVDLRAQNIPVRNALAQIGRQMGGERFDVAKEVQGNVNAWFINLPYNCAIDRITSQAGASCLLVGTAKPDPKRPTAAPPIIRKVAAMPAYKEKITLDLKEMDIRDCLRVLFRQTQHSYTIAVEIQGNCTVSVANEPLLSALAKTLAPVRGGFMIEGGIFCCTNTANRISPNALDKFISGFSTNRERRQDALSRFARQAGITLELEGNVNVGERITVKTEGQKAFEVLSAILGAKLAYRIQDGILIISPKA